MKQQDYQAIAFPTMLNALARPGAFPFALSSDEEIEVVQTHASAVLLVADRVYKLKKPKNFGFFDYSTPALRRHFCGQEVLVNRRLAPHIYLGVAPVLLSASGSFRFGTTYSPAEVALPGDRVEDGTVVDYAVVMVRLPDEAMLAYRVQTRTATAELLTEIARYVAQFHAAIPTSEYIAGFGTLEVIRGNWEENFEQIRPFIGRTIDVATYDRISGYIHRFMDERAALFASRVRDGYIRDCHGDLRLQHVYILDTQGVATTQPGSIVILDGIEFNERFRYSDVSSEVAFLAMELDAARQPALSQAFVESYVAATGDTVLRELLPFYTCYRACVRGKVASFQLDEAEVPDVQREEARQQAMALFTLAASYTNLPTRPTLLLIGGLMGTGKSTVAMALQRELGWVLFSSDTERKRLAHLNPAQPLAEAFDQGVYSRAWSARTYDALLEEAGKTLADGRSVLLDATFLRRTDRQAAARLAMASGARLLFVECTCPRDIILQRLEERWKARMQGIQNSVTTSSRASDARPDLYDAQAARWEAFEQNEEPESKHMIVSTIQPLATLLEQVRSALHLLSEA
ncbi:MAG TPA: AAA family ATPase [Ktedonobacteraceae bacterium]|nr:AAA family ATPase [Ktedonobacteraceae bacterium]